MTTIFIPSKALRDGKSRLAGVLNDRERHALCRCLLIHTLDMARALAPAGNIHVLASDAEARDLATGRGVAVHDDEGSGLNDALTRARETCAPASLLVLPIDLPLASIDDLKAVLDTDADVAIAPDAAHSGTNLLQLRRGAVRALPFSFGPGSLPVHRQAASALGLSVAVISRPGLAADIDTPQDYATWRDRHALTFAATAVAMPA